MTRDEITAWVDRRLGMLNIHDVDGLADFYTDDCLIDSPTAGRLASGRSSALAIDRTWLTGFPDVTFKTTAVLVDGERFAWIGTVSGSDQGGFMGMPATDKPFRVPMVISTTLRDGRIARERRVYDFTGLLMQIGVLKTRAVETAGQTPLPARPEAAQPSVEVGGPERAEVDVAALVRKHAVAFARRDLGALATLHTEDCVMESHLAGRVQGTDAIRDVYARWFASLPDSAFDSEETIADGTRAAEMAVMTGTDRGGFFGFAPTGRPIRARSAWLFTVRGRQFSHVHPIYDFTGMLVQMGLLRPKPI